MTNEEKVAMHCVQNDKNRVVNIRRLEADAALNLLEKVCLFTPQALIDRAVFLISIHLIMHTSNAIFTIKVS